MDVSQDYMIDYMTAKAVACGIEHDPDNGKKAVHVIDNPYDLEELENALRDFATFPALLIEESEGELDDNNAANYLDTKEFNIMVVDKRIDREPVRSVRSRCFQKVKEVLFKMRKDCRAHSIVPGKRINFRIQGKYMPVGPMVADQYYGYLVVIHFECPFSF